MCKSAAGHAALGFGEDGWDPSSGVLHVTLPNLLLCLKQIFIAIGKSHTQRHAHTHACTRTHTHMMSYTEKNIRPRNIKQTNGINCLLTESMVTFISTRWVKWRTTSIVSSQDGDLFFCKYWQESESNHVMEKWVRKLGYQLDSFQIS